MAVILVFYNPSYSVRIIQNILTVKHYLDKAHIPTFIGELAFDEIPFVFNASDTVFQFRSTSYMFYKENLIKLVVAKLPATYTKLCMMDADIMFDNPNWYSIISRRLDTVSVCQPFTRTVFLNLNFTPQFEKTNCVDSNASQIDWKCEHSGHIWAFRRDWYNDAAISDMTIIGGGDTILQYIVRGRQNTRDTTYAIYQHLIIPVPTPTLGSCDLTIYHLNHGMTLNRQHVSRIGDLDAAIRATGQTRVADVVQRRADGLLEWKPPYCAVLNTCVQRYFACRRDDIATQELSKTFKFFPIRYAPPATRDMVVLLVFFNLVQYNRIIQNILMVKHWLETANIPYYIAELAFDDAAFLFNQAPNIIRVRSTSYMFYKENLVAAIEPMIPASFTKICMLDADIMFGTPNWYSIVASTLNRVSVCQPFKCAAWLGIDYTEEIVKGSCLDSSSNKINWDKEHAGFAWAFTRDWYQNHPFKDISIVTTGGDTLLHDLIMGRTSSTYDLYQNEYERARQIARPTYESCSLRVYHLNHGTHKNRKYLDFLQQIRRVMFSVGAQYIVDTINKRKDGIVEWKPEFRTEFNRIITAYFESRYEDEVD
jgi:hypothetical protein